MATFVPIQPDASPTRHASSGSLHDPGQAVNRRQHASEAPAPEPTEAKPRGERTTRDRASSDIGPAATGEELSASEQRKLDKLEQRDAEVRAHEQAHVAAAGPLYRGGPHYTYQVGPDGKRYAVGGSVSIDTASVEGDPEATIAKAMRIRQAALAPAEPSPADMAVAARADRMKAAAMRELQQREAASPAKPAERPHESGEGDTDRGVVAPDAGRGSSASSFGDLIPTPLTQSVAELIGSLEQSRPSEALYTRPSDALYTRPTDTLLTRPSDDLWTRPTDELLTRPTDELLTPATPLLGPGPLYA